MLDFRALGWIAAPIFCKHSLSAALSKFISLVIAFNTVFAHACFNTLLFGIFALQISFAPVFCHARHFAFGF